VVGGLSRMREGLPPSAAARCGENTIDNRIGAGTLDFKQTRGRPACRISDLQGSGMIGATECRELAAECRQMADRAQTFRVRSILIDIARTWDRLALEVEHSTATITPKEVLRRPYEVFTRK
jgi:hypothetical protein